MLIGYLIDDLIHVLEQERNLNLIDDVLDKIGYPDQHLVAS